jgi:predicted transcriptional regulator
MPTRPDNLSVRIPPEIRQKVDVLARLTKRSRSYIINEAVASYVQSQSEFLKQIDEAVVAAETGVGHSKAQVFAWMDDWAEGNKRPLPKPDVLATD